MSATPSKTVRETGAEADDLLVGITPRNMGLVIRVNDDQQPGDGGRIRGAIDVLHWGTGTYATEILKLWHITQSFSSVEQFIEALESDVGSTDFTHGLNPNGLWRLDAQNIAERIIHSEGDA